jgi:hypothetical protein
MCTKSFLNFHFKRWNISYHDFDNINSNVVFIFLIINALKIKNVFIQRIQISIISIFVITKYKAQKSTFDKIVLDLKIKSRKRSEIAHQKFCFTYVQLSRLRFFFDLHIIEFVNMNDFQYQSNCELKMKTKRLNEL